MLHRASEFPISRNVYPKLAIRQVDDEGKLPAKLTQRDSGLADSIEPDSTGSRRQSLSPQSPEMSTDEVPPDLTSLT